MFKIKGYLKKFWYLILACICLLFVQAQTELTLPDYMSDIVSVGIQAGGFASPVSDVLTEETYQHLLLFVDQKDQKTVKKDYKKVSKVNQDIIDTFPKAKGKTVYQLKDFPLRGPRLCPGAERAGGGAPGGYRGGIPRGGPACGRGERCHLQGRAL